MCKQVGMAQHTCEVSSIPPLRVLGVKLSLPGWLGFCCCDKAEPKNDF